MARTAVRGRLSWQIAKVDDVVVETARVRTIVLGVSEWLGHRAGQHLDVRLTAEDGYRAEREYSIASAPGEPVAITVERLDDGEVSPYLTEELRAGDEIEVRGPIGGYFVWDVEHGGPLLLVAGGSGIVPLRACFGTGVAVRATSVRLLYSSRRIEDVIYRAELDEPAEGVEVVYTLTRSSLPAGRATPVASTQRCWTRSPGRRTRTPRSGLRLRAGELRRDGGERPRKPGLPAGSGEDGAVRSDGTLMEALDGNAIGGLLLEVLARR